MPMGYPGEDVKQATGNSLLEHDLSVLCIKKQVKTKGEAG